MSITIRGSQTFKLEQKSRNSDDGKPLVKMSAYMESLMKHEERETDYLQYKMNVDLNMFVALILYRVSGQIDCTKVATIDKGGLKQWTMKLKKKITYQTCLSNNNSNSVIFNFST